MRSTSEARGANTIAIRFVVLLGIVSLFADMTYEGARSATGPFLALLGASGTAVGIVAGFGELIGYGLRLLSGYITDKTRRYWTITLIGYSVNLIAVPLLALAGRWEVAAGLIDLTPFYVPVLMRVGCGLCISGSGRSGGAEPDANDAANSAGVP
jgi:hypothetical protein